MSWFGEFSAEGAGRQGDSGIVVERRRVLSISLGAFVALRLGWAYKSVAENNESGTRVCGEGDVLTWGCLVEQISQRAERLITEEMPDELEYLAYLESMVGRLGAAPDGQFDFNSPIAAAWSLRRFPIMVLQLRFEPGAFMPAHDHRDYNGVMHVISGAVRVRSFEIAGPRQPQVHDELLLKEVRDEVIAAGQCSSLSRYTNNIHEVRAQSRGARVLDILTFFREDARSVFLDIDREPRNRRLRIYDARYMF